MSKRAPENLAAIDADYHVHYKVERECPDGTWQRGFLNWRTPEVARAEAQRVTDTYGWRTRVRPEICESDHEH